MANGIVKWFNPDKGYGFIEPEDGNGADIFLHGSVLRRAGLETIAEGTKVTFETEQGTKGVKAKRIALI